MDLDGRAEATPIWLTDTDYPAPCPCGRPMVIGEPVMMVESDEGFKRVLHMACMQQMMQGHEDDEVG